MSRIAIGLLCALFMLPAYAQPREGVQVRIFQYFLAKARSGDPNAEFIVGNLYETGKGVPQDSNKAKKWYEKAAAHGNQSAKDKLGQKSHAAELAEKAKEKAAAEAAKKREDIAHARMKAQLAARARLKAQLAARARLEAERAARARVEAARAAQRMAIAKAAQTRAQQPINAMRIVLGGNWYQSQSAAQYLPSASTSCLQAGSSKIICFSERLNRAVGGSALTYTVKSTLSNFGRKGDFTVNYIYDVLDISGNHSDPAAGDGSADPAPQARLGWQQPGQTLRCRARNPQTLICSNQKNHSLEFAKR